MGVPIDRTGSFQANILEYGLNEYDSGAVAVNVKALITAAWNPEAQAWDDWTSYDVEAQGFLNIRKKDGSLNTMQVQSLVEHAGWDGRFEAIANHEWNPTPCQISITCEEYKGEKQYRIGFVNAFDRKPGASGNVDAGKAKALDTQHGAAIRAIFANAKRGKSAPAAGKPAAPPRAAKAEPVGAGTAASEEIPF